MWIGGRLLPAGEQGRRAWPVRAAARAVIDSKGKVAGRITIEPCRRDRSTVVGEPIGMDAPDPDDG